MAKQPVLDDFRVPNFDDKKAADFSLTPFDPASKPFSTGDKTADKARIAEIGTKLDKQQECLHAQHLRRVLLVLQGMDTSGKDGTIRAVFHEVDPLGLRIVPFKAPSSTELAHDFLWRVHAQAPAAGELAIFNRSHYEDLLVPTVLGQLDKDGFALRCRQIREFERLLAETGTTIVKCMLHISKDEQRERLQARIDNPDKHWKFDVSDLEARKDWDTYQAAYRNALAATSTDYAPWYIVPADSKTHRNLMIAELVLRAFESLELSYPPAKESLKGVKVE